jgi:hypothetical protein
VLRATRLEPRASLAALRSSALSNLRSTLSAVTDGHVYDHKNKVLYWRHQSNLQLNRVRLADVLSSTTPLSLPMLNDLPFFQDAADKFAKPKD